MTQPSYKTKSVLVIDKGMFTSLAELLVPHFGRVGYFCEWQEPFPDGRGLLIGSGLEGVERVKYLWTRTDDSPHCLYDFDLIVYPFCLDGDQQEDLRRRGFRVWGSGMKSSLELARWKTKQHMQKIGLPTADSVQLKGMDALRAYLKEHEDVFVKISTYRGITETFGAKNYDLVKGKLDDLEAKYAPVLESIAVVVEQSIPGAKETGYDGYCIDGEYPNTAFLGAEVKDKAYFGKVLDYDALPNEVKAVNTKLSYHMDGYRQFLSTELRDDKMIDGTCRHATPGGEPYCHAMTNLADVLWNGADGKLIHPQWSNKFAAQLILTSEWLREHPLLVQFPEEIRPWVKLYGHCRVNGKDWVINDEQKYKEVGNVIALGNTPDEAIKLCKARAEKIEAFQLCVEPEKLDEARKVLEESL
jgi:hypothetical protein